MINDTISDMLTRIRNAILVKHKVVKVPSTIMTRSIVDVLKHEGFIEDFSEIRSEHSGFILIGLKYKGKNRSSIIKKVKRISRPGLRIYSSSKELPKVLGGIGIAIISTSQGIMTSKEAKYRGVGGEVLCYVW